MLLGISLATYLPICFSFPLLFLIPPSYGLNIVSLFHFISWFTSQNSSFCYFCGCFKINSIHLKTISQPSGDIMSLDMWHKRLTIEYTGNMGYCFHTSYFCISYKPHTTLQLFYLNG